MSFLSYDTIILDFLFILRHRVKDEINVPIALSAAPDTIVLDFLLSSDTIVLDFFLSYDTIVLDFLFIL